MLPSLTEPSAGCIYVVLDFGTVLNFVLILVAILIPAVAVPVVARVARRNPSAPLLSAGRRPAGDRLLRWGLVASSVGVLGFISCLVLSAWPAACGDGTVIGAALLVSVLLTFVGFLMIGGGWAYSIRAGWVTLATLVILDSWIFLVNLAVGVAFPETINLLLLLAFAIHGLCSGVAARWMFNAQDLGPVERAKAGRSLSAVWVFLASYAALALFRDENGVFSSPAGSAVTGALTVGALAVTMGSGFTKYTEAMNAKPAARQTAVQQTVAPQPVTPPEPPADPDRETE